MKSGFSKSPLYSTWINMIGRTNNKNANRYDRYGGRGITVCDEWLKSFENFNEWCLSNGYIDSLSLDRIDNDGNYEPSNCRFTTREVQNRNTMLLNSKNTSGFRGVSYTKHAKKWSSKIRVSGKKIHLGYFKTALDAAIAYDNYVSINNLEHTKNFN